MSLLFLIDIIDISILPLYNAWVYGDDLYILSMDTELVKAGIDIVSRWVGEWHMPLNRSKTVHMSFSQTKLHYLTFQCDSNSPFQTLNGCTDLEV